MTAQCITASNANYDKDMRHQIRRPVKGRRVRHNQQMSHKIFQSCACQQANDLTRGQAFRGHASIAPRDEPRSTVDRQGHKHKIRKGMERYHFITYMHKQKYSNTIYTTAGHVENATTRG
eukprot:scaffold268_cov210-Ochromonas_danica.AAC.46